MVRVRSFISAATVLVALAISAGCGGSGDGIVPITGTLTYKGLPIPGAGVVFSPEGGGRPSSGTTDERGHFRLKWDKQTDGAEIGTHKVSIEYKPRTPAERAAIEIDNKPPPIPKELKIAFEKYSQANSKHKVTIDSSTRDLKVDLD